MDIIGKLAQNVIDAKYDSLPKEAIEVTKKSILDTLAVLVAGASDCEKEVGLVRDWGRKDESTVLVHGGKVPVANAAWINAIMASALDFDDSMEGALHISTCAIPTALAVSEAYGKVSGKELITAIAAGTDLCTRIHRASRSFGHSTTGTIVVFGTTAIAGKLLGLDFNGLMNALGIAFDRSSGSDQAAVDKVGALRAIRGYTARSGVESALMAQKGITGSRAVLQGAYGFFHVYSRDEGNLKAITDALGTRYEGVRIFLKQYPSCGTTLTATEAALRIAREVEINPKDVKQITVEVSPFVHSITGYPFRPGNTPRVDAQFSLAYCVANVILRKSALLTHFTEKSIGDPELMALAHKVNPVISMEMKKSKIESTGEIGSTSHTAEDLGARVTVLMNNGRKFVKEVSFDEVIGPFTMQDIQAKFRSCIECAPEALPAGNAEKIIRTIDQLEDLDDVSRLTKLFTK